MYIIPEAHLNDEKKRDWNHVSTTPLFQLELEALNAGHKLSYIIKLHIHGKMKAICSNNGFAGLLSFLEAKAHFVAHVCAH